MGQKRVYLVLAICMCFFYGCKKSLDNITRGEGKVLTDLTVGDATWTYDNCSLITNTLSAYKGTMTVQVITHVPNFQEGSYAITSGIPTSGQINFIILNPPGYLPGSKFYGREGSLIITQVTPSVIATFSNVVCKPVGTSGSPLTITASGSISCM